MYFSKIPHPANFVFAREADPARGVLPLADGEARVTLTAIGGDVHRVTVRHPRWPHNPSQAELAESVPGENAHAVRLAADGSLELVENASGRVALSGVPGATLGACGRTWLFQFRHEPTMQFYGLGEHSKGLEKSGQRVKFWNTDLFGDFAHCEATHGYANPMYVAIPWLIVKQGNHYIGLLVHNPGAVFMDLASNFVWSEANTEDRDRRSFYVGAPDGQPELYLVVGPTLPALLRKLQALVGRVPRPPLWALGHHQCRWGYGGPRDLAALDRGFRAHRIPCDGLWLDIDYMDRYKVFTYSREGRAAARVRRVLARLARRGRRVVPILDPGVKAEPGYPVFEDGRRAGIFCLTPEGRPYVGFVWPGKTHLPDFSLPEGRAWWTRHVRRLAADGFAGAWIDMNDPSVGAVELDDMLFGRGAQPHASYHNQYGLGMAQATRAGFLAARPDQRPFILTRSAYLSSSRYAAVWLGDNVSNWHHLRLGVPLALGLSMSGIPFNGPDVCGFMGNTTPALAVAWYKACFLFPFLRNHSTAGTRPQEPWALGPEAGRAIAHYIRLRYKLLPYLYQLFLAQEESGEAILRPLFHDFPDTRRRPLGQITDQFLVGPSILQAPILAAGRTRRRVVLPAGTQWFSAQDGRWLPGGKTILSRAGRTETPLFVREGSILPLQPGERTHNRNDLATIELHCFLRPDSGKPAVLRYACDDGETFGYQRGEVSRFTVKARALPGGVLAAEISDGEYGFGPVRVRLVVYGGFKAVRLTGDGKTRLLPLVAHAWRFVGAPLAAHATRWLKLGAGKRAPTARAAAPVNGRSPGHDTPRRNEVAVRAETE